jgi:hypothetical protein
MRIAVLTLAIGDDFKRKVYHAVLSHKKYCAIHGYDFIDDESVYDETRPHSWSKIRLMQKYLPLYDYVVWIDADAMIINKEHKIQDKINAMMGNKDIMVVKPFFGINLGVIFLRNSITTMKMLETIYNETDFILEGDWENAAFIHIYENDPEFASHVEVMSCNYEPDIQCFLPQYRPGIFIVHLAGWRRDTLQSSMEGLLRWLHPFQLEEDEVHGEKGENEEEYEWRLNWIRDESQSSVSHIYENAGHLNFFLKHPTELAGQT